MDLRQQLRYIRDSRAKVLVVGLGLSGIESLKFCQRIKLDCLGLERESEENYRRKSKYCRQVDDLRANGASIHFSVDGEGIREFVKDAALCILSPGVSLQSKLCDVLRSNRIKIISELELALELLSSPSIVVTGSNGKSTTVSLIHEMCLRAGMHSVLCGNVGSPVISLARQDILESAPDASNSVLVVEASSYQLETSSLIKPKIGVLLNISANHLERHKTIENYLAIKAKLFERQDSTDYALINSDDERTVTCCEKLKAPYGVFGLKDTGVSGVDKAEIKFDVKNKTDLIYLNRRSGSESYEIGASRLLGMHNRYNIAAALLAARQIGVSLIVAQEVINNFTPLEHRFELFRVYNQVTFVNDSKSTTVASTVAALTSLLEAKQGGVVLMIGGQAKEGSWEPLWQTVLHNRDRVISVLCFGKDGPQLGAQCDRKGIANRVISSMHEVLKPAMALVQAGDTVLLSPGCASFDEFQDFEHRGSVFKQLVNQLKQGI